MCVVKNTTEKKAGARRNGGHLATYISFGLARTNIQDYEDNKANSNKVCSQTTRKSNQQISEIQPAQP